MLLYGVRVSIHDVLLIHCRVLRSSGSDSDMELVKHIKENYIHRVHQAVQVSNPVNKGLYVGSYINFTKSHPCGIGLIASEVT